MKTAIFTVAVWMLAFAGGVCRAQKQGMPDSTWIDATLQRMTLEEKIGQLFMVAAYSNQSAAYEEELEKQVRKYHLGGLIFFQGEPMRQVKLTNRYQRAAKYPLLIGLDAEHGAGWRLKTAMEFPKMGIIGAIREDSLVFALGAAIARHCRELGVHVNFAPVVDINNNPHNPVIGIRSFGEKPEEVVRKARSFIQGSLAGGVLPVVKHFPGHGDTDTDSHKALPAITKSRAALESTELYPYRALMASGVPAVMTSHLNVPALDASGLPASLSPAIINGLLKKEMGFGGICFTDAMNMKGVTQNTPPGEAEVKALLAGNDVLLFPENVEKAVQAIRKAVADSVLNEALITEKCRKILACKYRYALPNLHPSEAVGLWSRINTPADLALRSQLYKEAITLVENRNALLPLKRLDTLRIASLNFGGKSINNFQTMLQHYTPVTHFTVENHLSDEALLNWEKILHPYNCIVIYNQAGNNSAGKQFGYSASLSRLIQSLKGKRIIFCHPAIPYGLEKYAGLPLDAILVSYEHHLSAQQYAAQAIFGGIGIHGQLPVRINDAYPAGRGIMTKKNRLGYESAEVSRIAPATFPLIDSLCEEAIRMEATPGCQVLLAQQGEIIYNKAFGYHTYHKRQANHTDDVYDIASVTKILATLPAVMKLYDEGRIALDTPLSNYYRVLRNTDKEEMTVREVLCHHAGLKTFLPLLPDAIDKASMPGPLFSIKRTPSNTLRLKERLYANPNYKFKDSTLVNTPHTGYRRIAPGIYLFPGYQDTIFNRILYSPLAPEKTYAYSDLGFIFLKYAVEETSGKSIESYCRENFFQKLGMYHTEYGTTGSTPKDRIIPSARDDLYRKTELRGTVHDPTAALLGGVAGHAGLFSTAEDIAKMLQMYLNKGEYGGEQYLSAHTIDLFTCQNNCFQNNRRGLGFDKPEADSTKISPVCCFTPLTSYGHTGFTGIMAWCDPENELIYIFMSNRTYPNEFNTKLTDENIRTKIQEAIYSGLNFH